MNPVRFSLTQNEKHDPLWMKLSAYLRERLELRRGQNDTAQSAEDTALLRGRIAELKELLALEADRPVIKN